VVEQQFRRFRRGQHLDSVPGSQLDGGGWIGERVWLLSGSSMLVDGLDIASKYPSDRTVQTARLQQGEEPEGGRQVVERVRLVPGRKIVRPPAPSDLAHAVHLQFAF